MSSSGLRATNLSNFDETEQLTDLNLSTLHITLNC